MMSRTTSVASIVLLTALGGCAIRTVMPGFRRVTPLPEAGRSDRGVTLPPRGQYFHSQKIETTHDSTGTQTRLSVTTHRGSYFLWIQHPRVTFFFDVGNASAPPAVVSLLFRTVDPQIPVSRQLTTICDGTATTEDVKSTYWYARGPILAANISTYDIPVPEFARLVQCQSLTIDAGGVRADFGYEQLQALRDLASRIP